MGELDETPLPGIGKRVEFRTAEGRRVGVVQHHTGRREVFVCRPGDPDMTEVSVALDEDEAHSLVEALGVVSVRESDEDRSYEVEGLVFDWIDVPDGSPVVGHTIGEERVRTRTGASVVAVIRHPGAIPAPEPDMVLQVGDTLIVAGTAEGAAKVRSLVRAG